MILLNLAEIHSEQERYEDARTCLDRSLAIFQDLDSPYWQGRVHSSLGNLFAKTGQPAAAAGAWEHALRLLQPLGAPEANAVAALLREHRTAPAPG